MKFDIFITGEIDNEKSTEIIKELIKLKNQTIINIFINSDGGSLTDTLAIVDMIKISPVTKAYIFGSCYSTAALIALSCTTCYMSTNASMLIHLPIIDLHSNCNYKEVLDERYNIEVYKEMMDTIIDGRVEYSEKILTARQCLQKKLISNLI